MPLLHSVLLYLERLAESIAGAMGVPRRPLRLGKATLNAVLASAPEPTFDLLDWCFHWPSLPLRRELRAPSSLSPANAAEFIKVPADRYRRW